MTNKINFSSSGMEPVKQQSRLEKDKAEYEKLKEKAEGSSRLSGKDEKRLKELETRLTKAGHGGNPSVFNPPLTSKQYDDANKSVFSNFKPQDLQPKSAKDIMQSLKDLI